jgi:hypothetical protein
MAAGQAIYSAGQPQQPCGMIANAAPSPAGGHDALAVVQESFRCVPAALRTRQLPGGSQRSTSSPSWRRLPDCP